MEEFNNYFKSAFTVDNVIFGFDNGDLKVLLIKRGEEPYTGKWALPGYFVYPNEDLDTAANRILEELTSIKNVYLEQVKTFGAVNRHPFGRVITVAFFSLIKISHYNLQPASIAKKAQWHSVSKIGDLAFDHNEILAACLNRLKWLVRTRPVGFELLPPKFTLTELQHLYESILETELDKRNFRKKILSMNLLIDLEESQEGVAHRPARLYKFDKEKYKQFLAEGFNFEVKESKKKETQKTLSRKKQLQANP
ncbi:MAG TPA: NUDIX domain-containing protein [Saprospiraceae bacterium]|nr:NUDIX domain-containing protein [Saprospiraceae bacterium]HMQ82221.1 NUDIX domain-containing protein [Saprospiraceae bacterium]